MESGRPARLRKPGPLKKHLRPFHRRDAHPPNFLGDDLINDMSVHIGQSKILPLIFISELLVLDSHEVQRGGVEVVDVEGILRCGEAEGVGLAGGMRR